MDILPLFPLQTVLFPGIPLRLHIFEERYKQMIEECLRTRSRFGVVLIRKGREALGPLAEPYDVGCAARIVRAERLDQGRLNLIAMGAERFRIQTLTRDQPYLVGEVSWDPLPASDDRQVAQEAERLRPWFTRYLETVSALEQASLTTMEAPQEPLALAYLAAYLLQIPLPKKQELLEASTSVHLLRELRKLYRKEIGLLTALLTERNLPGQGSFSLN